MHYDFDHCPRGGGFHPQKILPIGIFSEPKFTIWDHFVMGHISIPKLRLTEQGPGRDLGTRSIFFLPRMVRWINVQHLPFNVVCKTSHTTSAPITVNEIVGYSSCGDRVSIPLLLERKLTPYPSFFRGRAQRGHQEHSLRGELGNARNGRKRWFFRVFRVLQKPIKFCMQCLGSLFDFIIISCV